MFTKVELAELGFHNVGNSVLTKLQFFGKLERTWRLFPAEHHAGFVVYYNSSLKDAILGGTYGLDATADITNIKTLKKLLKITGGIT